MCRRFYATQTILFYVTKKLILLFPKKLTMHIRFETTNYCQANLPRLCNLPKTCLDSDTIG